MSDVAIHVEGLGKQYQIGARQAKKNIREGLTDMMAWPVRAGQALLHRRERVTETAAANTFWALKDVSFDVGVGQVIGIIGRNGAGKSTLLKILSRITKPTEGYADVRGRVGTLLEVGTGFHPELTGRENVYLNGAILGMKQAEVRLKFDEIVAFSEIERFIDTPVKHYSSGMYVRLAFAVAAHLEPDILIVDEVLAVGDLAFQQKCLAKLEADAIRRNVATLYVSHNLGTIKRVCSTVLLLEEGILAQIGDAGDVCNEYLRRLNAAVVSRITRGRLEKSEEATIYDCWFQLRGTRIAQLTLPERLELHALIDVALECRLSFEVTIKDASGHAWGFAQYGLTKNPPVHLETGRYELCLHFPELELAIGRYHFDVSIGEPNRKYFDLIQDALIVDVLAGPDQLTGWSFIQSKEQGSILLECDLQIVSQLNVDTATVSIV